MSNSIEWPDHLTFGVRLRGDLDVAALRRALDGVVERHEAWRTTFGHDEGGRPRHEVLPAAPMPVATFDLTDRQPAQREAQLARILGEQARRPFRPSSEPPVRACLLTLGEREHGLFVTAHRLAADPWTWELFAADLSALYRAARAGDAPPPPAGMAYGAFAAWRRQRLDAGLDEHLEWARERFAGAPPVLDLPADRPRPAQPAMAGGLATFDVPAGVVDGLLRAGGSDVSLFTTLLTGLAALLARCAGEEEVVVLSPLPARDRRELRGLLGPVSPPVPLRLDCSGGPTFGELARRVQDTVADADEHRDLPFDRLLDALGIEPVPSFHPLCQVGFALMDPPWARLAIDGVEVSELAPADLPARLDLDLTVLRCGDGLAGRMRYAADLFEPDTVDRLCAGLTTLLADAAVHPDRPASRLALLDEGGRTRALVDWNRTDAPQPDGARLQELFETRAAEAPDAVAVVAPGERLTYAELNRRSNRMAHHLRSLGVGPERVVATFLPRSTDLVVAFLASLKAGGAYLPLDPAYPPQRLEHVCGDAGVAVTITNEALEPSLPAGAGGTIVLERARAAVEAEPDANPELVNDPDDLAYLIYTSGSTGVPKGVEVPHRGACNLAAALTRTFQLRPEDLVALFASTSFDASVWEMEMALLNGSGLYVLETGDRAPDEIAAELREAGVTAGTFPPSFLRALADHAVPSLRLVVAAGEQCPSDLVRAWGAGRTFVNAYGPTEATVCATWARCDPSAAETPPIGTPLPNVRVYVLDGEQEPVPVAVPGELHIAGVGLARGYRNRPDLTAAAFVPNPHGPAGSRMYRTGDVAAYRRDGSLQYVGRIDHQVKVRGFRVELGEVEAAVARHPGIREAVVTVAGNDAADARLVAYLVLEAEARAIAGRSSSSAGLRGDLHRFLAGTLPAYMLPGAYVVLDELPLTTSGKIDRGALPEPDAAPATLEDEFAGPTTPTEKAVAEIWAKVLDLERVARDDNFLEVGGHSLVAAQVMAQLRQRFGVRLPVRLLFEHPALSDFASAVDAAVGDRVEANA